MEVLAEATGAICDEEPLFWKPSAGMILAAAQDSGKYKCLEECARARQRCEERDVNRPGSKDNVKWSKQCQSKYSNCMNTCN
jgi:hypothetical protein